MFTFHGNHSLKRSAKVLAEPFSNSPLLENFKDKRLSANIYKRIDFSFKCSRMNIIRKYYFLVYVLL